MELNKIKKGSAYVDKLCTAMGSISFIAIIAMTLLNVVDVVMARLINEHVLGSVELSSRLLMCSVFAAFAYCQSKKSHITMTLILARLPRAPRFIIFTIMSIVSLGTIILATYAAYQQTVVAFNAAYVTEVLKFPLYPFYVLETLSFAIFAIATLYDTFVYAVAIFRDDAAEMVQEHWN